MMRQYRHRLKIKMNLPSPLMLRPSTISIATLLLIALIITCAVVIVVRNNSSRCLLFYSELGQQSYCQPGDSCWKTIDVNTLSPKQIIDYLMWTNRSACQIAQDFGGQMLGRPTAMIDGQKAICLDPAVRPDSYRCIVYSFGINNDFSFDELMEKYGCRVYAFDPSMGVSDHDHSERIRFFNLGLDDRDYVDPENNWRMKNLASIYQLLHRKQSHQRSGPKTIIDFLKLDIEFAEWRVLPHLIKTGMLNRIRQLHVEIHLTKDDSLELLRQRVGIIKAIEDAGMIRFDSRGNPYYRSVIESLDKKANLSLGYDLAWYQLLPPS